MIAAAAISMALTTAGPATASPADTVPGEVASATAIVDRASLPPTSDGLLLEYWSRGSDGQPRLSTGVVYVPAGDPPSGGWPIVSYAHGTAGIGDTCLPALNDRARSVSAKAAPFLAAGYAFAATDYIGFGTPGVLPYLDGRAAAHSVVDMVRAARAVLPALAPSWAVVGQSQGGQAALFTADRATTDAPDLDFRGTVAVGPPSQFDTLLQFAAPAVPPIPFGAGSFAYILAGLRDSRPDLRVDDYLTPVGRRVVDGAEAACDGPQLQALTDGVAIGDMLSVPLLGTPLATALRDTMSVPVTGYDRPLLIIQGITDTTVPAPLTATLVTQLLLNGQPVTVRPFPGNHVPTENASMPTAVEFVQSLFANQRPLP